MQTKPLLYGLIGFFLGGLLVSIAATTFNKPPQADSAKRPASMSTTSMDAMTATLKNKMGDDYDKAFLESMIAHHEDAVKMAKLSAENAKHDEIKTLSTTIIAAQEKEIAEMKRRQTEWGYSSMIDHGSMRH